MVLEFAECTTQHTWNHFKAKLYELQGAYTVAPFFI